MGAEVLPLPRCSSGVFGGAVDVSGDWEDGRSEEGFGGQ